MPITAEILRRFIKETTGPKDVINAVTLALLEQMSDAPPLTQATKLRLRDYHVRIAAGELPPEKPWTHAREIRRAMIEASQPGSSGAGLFWSAIRAALVICKRPLTERQLYRILTNDPSAKH